jgi:hypothetical protein
MYLIDISFKSQGLKQKKGKSTGLEYKI